jgi:hypothetical protein
MNQLHSKKAVEQETLSSPQRMVNRRKPINHGDTARKNSAREKAKTLHSFALLFAVSPGPPW